jgi:hypothetical protein
MSRYKIEAEFEIDFDKIFAKIPEGLFSSEEKGPDKDYEISIIYDVIRESYLSALMKNMDDMAKDKEDGMYKYLKHHNECAIQASKAIIDNLKITKL